MRRIVQLVTVPRRDHASLKDLNSKSVSNYALYTLQGVVASGIALEMRRVVHFSEN